MLYPIPQRACKSCTSRLQLATRIVEYCEATWLLLAEFKNLKRTRKTETSMQKDWTISLPLMELQRQ